MPAISRIAANRWRGRAARETATEWPKRRGWRGEPSSGCMELDRSAESSLLENSVGGEDGWRRGGNQGGLELVEIGERFVALLGIDLALGLSLGLGLGLQLGQLLLKLRIWTLAEAGDSRQAQSAPGQGADQAQPQQLPLAIDRTSSLFDGLIDQTLGWSRGALCAGRSSAPVASRQRPAAHRDHRRPPWN